MTRVARAALLLTAAITGQGAGAATSQGSCMLARDCTDTSDCTAQTVTLDWSFEAEPQITLDGHPHRAERIAGGALELNDTAADAPASLIQFWDDTHRGSLTPGPGASVTLIRVTLPDTDATAPDATATETTDEADLAAATRLYSGTCEGLF